MSFLLWKRQWSHCWNDAVFWVAMCCAVLLLSFYLCPEAFGDKSRRSHRPVYLSVRHRSHCESFFNDSLCPVIVREKFVLRPPPPTTVVSSVVTPVLPKTMVHACVLTGVILPGGLYSQGVMGWEAPKTVFPKESIEDSRQCILTAQGGCG